MLNQQRRESQRQWYLKNRDRLRVKARARYLANPEKCHAADAKWRNANRPAKRLVDKFRKAGFKLTIANARIILSCDCEHDGIPKGYTCGKPECYRTKDAEASLKKICQDL